MKKVVMMITASVFVLTLAAQETKKIDLNKKKYRAGIEIYGAGNEPFWSVDIDLQKGILFKMANGYTIKTPVIKGQKAMDANVTGYFYKTDSVSLTVQIMQQDYVDNMSGDSFNYKMSVDLTKRGSKEPVHYEGYAVYIPDYKLNGSWMLQKINNTLIPNSDSTTKPIAIEINAEKKNFSGFLGCNQMGGGNLFLELSTLRFEPGMMTMMACPHLDTETELVTALKAITGYRIVRNQLVLTTGSKAVLTFRRQMATVMTPKKVA